jgi:hypothetical protein
MHSGLQAPFSQDLCLNRQPGRNGVNDTVCLQLLPAPAHAASSTWTRIWIFYENLESTIGGSFNPSSGIADSLRECSLRVEGRFASRYRALSAILNALTNDRDALAAADACSGEPISAAPSL